MPNTEEMLVRLSKSKFRSRFRLKQNDFDYIKRVGIEKIKEHAKDFISTRLSQTDGFVDGKQTPMRGHPVFIAQHATATCCRECIFKWHKIPTNRQLSESEQEYIFDLIILWVEKQIEKNDC